MTPAKHYFAGLDLGKDRDPSALCVLAYVDTPAPALDLVTLIRVPLGTPYLEVMRKFRRVMTTLLAGNPPPTVHVAVDAAGPGQLAVELIEGQKLGIHLTPALLTAAIRSNRLPNGKVTVPRRQILALTSELIRRQTLRISRGLRYGPMLEQEFARVQTSGGQPAHDDLAIATALAAWQALRAHPALRRPACALMRLDYLELAERPLV